VKNNISRYAVWHYKITVVFIDVYKEEGDKKSINLAHK
jgi:hypothetical protein